MSCRRLSVLTAALFLVGPSSAFAFQAAQAGPRAPATDATDAPIMRKVPQDLIEVKPGLYMITGAGGNVAFRVMRSEVILVDTKNPGEDIYRDLLSKIRSVSDKPIRTVINTHNHADHVGNNDRFISAGATVVGHRRMTARIAAMRLNPPMVTRPAAPTVTFGERSRTVQRGQVVLYHLGAAHTDTDVVVHFPDLKAVATGDAYVAVTPGIIWADGGSLIGTRDMISNLLKLNFDTAIAGHGLEPTPRRDIERFKADLDKVIERGVAAIRNGATRETLISQIDDSDLTWKMTARIWSNPAGVERLFAELSGEAMQRGGAERRP